MSNRTIQPIPCLGRLSAPQGLDVSVYHLQVPNIRLSTMNLLVAVYSLVILHELLLVREAMALPVFRYPGSLVSSPFAPWPHLSVSQSSSHGFLSQLLHLSARFPDRTCLPPPIPPGYTSWPAGTGPSQTVPHIPLSPTQITGRKV